MLGIIDKIIYNDYCSARSPRTYSSWLLGIDFEVFSFCFESFISDYLTLGQMFTRYLLITFGTNKIEEDKIEVTEEIQKIIDQILSKSNFLHKIVIEERDKNSHLNIEIERLNKLLSEKNEECLLLSKNLDSVQSALSLTENKVIENPGQTIGKSEQEIDELVKEIEFCIEQLKQ